MDYVKKKKLLTPLIGKDNNKDCLNTLYVRVGDWLFTKRLNWISAAYISVMHGFIKIFDPSDNQIAFDVMNLHIVRIGRTYVLQIELFETKYMYVYIYI